MRSLNYLVMLFDLDCQSSGCVYCDSFRMALDGQKMCVLERTPDIKDDGKCCDFSMDYHLQGLCDES